MFILLGGIRHPPEGISTPSLRVPRRGRAYASIPPFRNVGMSALLRNLMCSEGDMKAALATYLAPLPEGVAKSDGVKLGLAVAAKVLEARTNDGCDAPDAYRPRTTPGVYVPNAITLSSMWPNMKPFAISSPSQFRPKPPVALDSKEWAKDYNEIKDYGGKISAKRTAEQTETALFWTSPLLAYQPMMRQLVTAKQMDVVDSARFMALEAVGLNDAIIAVLDAKYHYNFWRPITAIRNGDI